MMLYYNIYYCQIIYYFFLGLFQVNLCKIAKY